jgi:hypothetical protein
MKKDKKTTKEIYNEQHSIEREQFLKDFRKNNNRDMIERLFNFMMPIDQVIIDEEGAFGFGAFHEKLFKAPTAPGTTSMEIFGTTAFARQFTKEYIISVISMLLEGGRKDKEDDTKKETTDNDYLDKE